MNECVLVLNAGSSSLKFCVFLRASCKSWLLDARGQVSGIGTCPRLSVRSGAGEILADQDVSAHNGRNAVDVFATWVHAKYRGVTVLGAAHRVVHGGSYFHGPTQVTPEVLDRLRALIPLAPLHQPYNLAIIEAAMERLPGVLQVACFDTSFHQGRPAVAELVPLPRSLRLAGLKRYGFHGLSYEYVASVLPKVAPKIAGGRVIVAHLGSGASMCAMKEGKSVDNTFGFTALDGLCMGTRPGALDPGVVLHLFQKMNFSGEEVETILYEKSGLLGISGISSDMRDLLGRSDPDARLAVDYFVYRAAKEIGALTAVLGGLDAIVFTAGIGENSAEIRRRICEASAWLGVEIDQTANENHQAAISTANSKVSVHVISTNEELMIARHAGNLLRLRQPVRPNKSKGEDR
jgi:acetate kinase